MEVVPSDVKLIRFRRIHSGRAKMRARVSEAKRGLQKWTGRRRGSRKYQFLELYFLTTITLKNDTVSFLE